MQKYGTAEESTDGSIIRRRVDAVCLLDNQGKSKDMLVIFDAYCFSTAGMVSRARLSVTLYVLYIAFLV